MRKKTAAIGTIVLLGIFFSLALFGQEIDLTQRMAGLCRVWGFLKYYHNNVAQGKIGWNTVLIHFIPRVTQAETKDAFNHEIMMLIRAAGVHPNAPDPTNPFFDGQDGFFSWIDDETLFNPYTSSVLKGIGEAFRPGYNFYFSKPRYGSAEFVNDNAFENKMDLSIEYMLLSLFRYWNIVNYFFPYNDVMDEDWDQVLEEFIPRMMAVAGMKGYNNLFVELQAHLNDGHAFSGSPYNYLWGRSYAPLKVRWIENRTVVTCVLPTLLAGADVRMGDVITHVNGEDIEILRQKMRKYIPGSNEMAIQTILGDNLISANDIEMTLKIDRGGTILDVKVPTYDHMKVQEEWISTFSQPAYRILPGNIGYVLTGLLQAGDENRVMSLLLDTKAIVFDMRMGSSTPAWTIMQDHLFSVERLAARWKFADMSRPGKFYFSADEIWGPPDGNPHSYKGKIVALVDEYTMSSGEYMTMVLQSIPGTKVIGSQTAGADGNVTSFTLPGRLQIFFSGLGVFYPDLRPTQRVGIAIDITVRPTVTGTRVGRDEMLERALEFIDSGK